MHIGQLKTSFFLGCSSFKSTSSVLQGFLLKFLFALATTLTEIAIASHQWHPQEIVEVYVNHAPAKFELKAPAAHQTDSQKIKFSSAAGTRLRWMTETAMLAINLCTCLIVTYIGSYIQRKKEKREESESIFIVNLVGLLVKQSKQDWNLIFYTKIDKASSY